MSYGFWVMKIEGLFGLEEFWVIWSKTHNWVIKTHGTHTNFFVWLDFHIVFLSLKTHKIWVRVMETQNKNLVFSKTEIHNLVAPL